MNHNFPISRKISAAILTAALLLPSASAPAWANVVAAANAGHIAVNPGAAAGGAVRNISLTPRLGGLTNSSNITLGQTLPGADTPSLSHPGLISGLQFVVAPKGIAPTPASLKSVSLVAAQAHTQSVRTVSAESLTRDSKAKKNPKATPLRRVLSAIGKAINLGRTERIFENSARRMPGLGILPDNSHDSDPGIPLDEAPEQPVNTETPSLSWNRVHFPGELGQPTGLDLIFRGTSVRPVALPGNPTTAAGVEGALRRLIGENPREFGGITPDQLETVLANKAEGREGLSDTIYLNFRQRLQTLPIEGSYLNFTIKIIDGEAILVGSSAQLFPSLSVDAFGRLSDEEIQEYAFERLGRPTGSYDDLLKIGRRVMHIRGRWRSVYLILSESKSLMAAVDVNSGETFAWDPRYSADVDGRTEGRGVEFDPGATGENLDVMPLGHTEVTTSDGRTFYTDADGYFTLDGVNDGEEVTITTKLKGRYAQIRDQGSSNLTVTAVARPGEAIQLLFNPEGAEENAVAQVNAYRHATKVHDWLVAQGIDNDSIHRSLPIKTNIGRDCNAYYTPWSPSLNFFSGSQRCSNTAFDSVVYHEYGHFVDDMLGGIVNGAVSEGWGDILSMYITGTPEIGRGFLKNREESWIRHGDNKYQFRARDEVHKQGQAWMGFAWKLRKALIASFEAAGLAEGEATRRGTDLASALVIPILFANVRNIPQAIEAVLMRDVGDDGRAAHFKEIYDAAAAHGIELKEPRPGQVVTPTARKKRRFTGWLSAAAGRLSKIVSG